MLLNNKQSFNILRSEMEAALLAVAKKHGLTMKTTGISYESHGGECTIKVNVTTNKKPKVASKMEESMLDMYGLKGYFNVTIQTRDKKLFKVIGINSRCRKSPVILESINCGRSAKCSVDYVLKNCTIYSHR